MYKRQPYTYTRKEIRVTGFPRQDALFVRAENIPAQDINVILVMPTWRGSLVDQRSSAGYHQAATQAFIADSQYVRHWSSFLNSDELRNLALQYGKKIVFFPHPNAIPFLDVFETPSHVEEMCISDSEFFFLLFQHSRATEQNSNKRSCAVDDCSPPLLFL